jgi:hypothetical protein
MHGLLIIAAVLGTASTEMQTLAASPAETIVSVSLDEAVVKDGADKNTVHAQVELALRRCGFTITDLPATHAAVDVTAMPTSPARGWFATVLFKVRTLVRHDGNLVFVDVTTDQTLIAGPPGSAASQIRTALEGMLDQFCNNYLAARQEAAKGRETAAAR